jgi:carbonic anhydrase
MSINGLIKGLREFRKNYFCTHQELFQRLSHCQAPEVLFISCCDSRIDPNLLTQTQPGDLFILRNIGNMIPPYGITHSSEGAAIEYAVQALKVKDIIICGHSDCGAMKGLLQLGKLSEQMPLVYDWLRHHGQATRRLVEDNYKEYSGESFLRVTIEENILTQIQNLETYPVIRSKLRSGELYLHAWVYEIEMGRVFAYNASLGQFVPIENPSPVPNPLTNIHA